MYSNVRFGLNKILQIIKPTTAPISPKIRGLEESLGAIKYPPRVVILLIIRLHTKSLMLTTSYQTSIFFFFSLDLESVILSSITYTSLYTSLSLTIMFLFMND